jgi:endonuclease/exonuclease/phosphatase (EEP) superfamily protein YafD
MTTHMDWPYPIERQRDEFAAVAEAANTIEGPLLVVGDFNSTPWSYSIKAFEAASGLTRETRNLMTYPELFTTRRGLIRLEPFLPLDHVFQRGLTVSELAVGEQTGSDHRPVVFTFSVAP